MSPSQYFSVMIALHARGHDAASGADHDHPHWMHEHLVPDPYYVFDLGLPFDSPHLFPHVVVTLSSPAPFEILNDFEFALPGGLLYQALPKVVALSGPGPFEGVNGSEFDLSWALHMVVALSGPVPFEDVNGSEFDLSWALHMVVALSSPVPFEVLFEILNDFEFALPEGLPYQALPEVAALPGPVPFETGHDPPQESPYQSLSVPCDNVSDS
jgi:hypothetical protein